MICKKSKAHSSVLVGSRTARFKLFYARSVLCEDKKNKTNKTCLDDNFTDSINLITFHQETDKKKKKVFKYFIKLIWQCKHEKQANSICLSFLCKNDWNLILAWKMCYIESVHCLNIKGGHLIWMNFWFCFNCMKK